MLKEELNCETVFTIPIGKGIPVFESVAVTWVIMAVLVVLSLILVRNLKVENNRKREKKVHGYCQEVSYMKKYTCRVSGQV